MQSQKSVLCWPMHIQLCLSVCCLLIASTQQVGAEDRILSYRELFDDIRAWEGPVYRLEDAIIRPNPETDGFLAPQNSIYSSAPIVFDKQIELKNIAFEAPSFSVAIFKNVHFLKKLVIESPKPLMGETFWLTIDSCEFFDDVRLLNMRTPILISDSRFHRNVNAFNLADRLMFKMEDCDFSATEARDSQGAGPNYRLGIFCLQPVGSYVEIWKSVFPSSSVKDQAIIWGDFGVVSLLDNEFHIPLILGSKVNSAFDFYGNQMHDIVSFEHVFFSPHIARVPWDQFAGHKLAVGGGPNNPEFYRAINDEYLRDDRRYELLNAAYYKLLNVYSQFGDTDSYNACYTEVKDLETQRLLISLEDNAGFTVFFKYVLNVFLRDFSNYGTSPAKALVVSVYVIIAFAILYLFMPNTWTTSSRHRLLNRLWRIKEFLQNPRSIKESIEETPYRHVDEYDQFIRDLMNTRNDLPTLFRIMAPRIYSISITGQRARKWAYNRLDVLSNSWITMGRFQRTITSFMTAIYMCFALGGYALLSILNALIVSLNAFSTLGFGGIPVRGVARYVVILEGLVGWLMLTIFSVSLIGQLLR
jgi:hypothetical protein